MMCRFLVEAEFQHIEKTTSLYLFGSSDEHTTVCGDVITLIMLREQPREFSLSAAREFSLSAALNLYCTPHVCLPVSAPVLSRLLVETNCLKHVNFSNLVLHPDQWAAIAALTKPGITISISLRSGLTRGATAALGNGLRDNQGDTSLKLKNFDTQHWDLFAAGLVGNRTLKYLSLTGAHALFRVLGPALSANLGLVELCTLNRCTLRDHCWTLLCRSLWHHPSIETLGLLESGPVDGMSIELKRWRMKALAQILETNHILHTIRLSSDECDEPILEKEVKPRLLINLHRPRVRAIEHVEDSTLRSKLLLRALALPSIRSNPVLVHMFLSTNLQVLVCS
jgi:hypothetical protein